MDEIQAAATARHEAAQEAIKAWREVFRIFGVEDFNAAESPFGNYVTIDIDPDEALAMAETLMGVMD